MATAILAPIIRQKFTDDDGNPLSGGRLYTYVAGSAGAVNKATFKDAGEVAMNTNPIILDPDGGADIWLQDDGAYLFVLKDVDLNVIDTVDNVPGGPHTSLAATFAAIEAEIAALSASVLTFNPGTLNSSPTTLQKKLRERKTINDFWVAPDADYTNAFTKAVTYINSVGGNMAVSLPFGSYGISGDIGAILVDEGGFIGDGFGAVVNISYNGPCFVWGNKGVSGVPYGGGVENCILKYPATPGANAVLFLQNGADGQNFRNIRPQNFRTLLQAGPADGTSIGNAAFIDGVKGFAYNGGSPCFNLYKCAGLTLSGNNAIYLAGVPNPAVNRTSTMVSAVGSALIKANGYTVDTVKIDGIYERWYQLINIVTPGTGPVFLNFETMPGMVADYISSDCVHLEAVAGSGGIVSHSYHGYMNSWSGDTVSMTGAGVIRLVHLYGIASYFSGKNGALVDGANISGIHFWPGCTFSACDRLNTGMSGIKLNSGNDFTLLGCKAGYDDAAGGLAWKPIYGIFVGVDIDKITIDECDADGVTNHYKISDQTHVSGYRRINKNRNSDYFGDKTGTGIYIAPASGVPWVNTGYTRCWFSAHGAGVTSIQRNGVTVSSAIGGGTVPVDPGETAGWGGPGPANAVFYIEA